MMELLVPLGLLGLIGIAVLILIYLIRPNYQTKHIPSTYIWKLSLSYRRKRPPVSRIRNIILFICQVLILTSMALIMAWPAIVERTVNDETDVIYILDSSASMHAETDGVTRFDRAVSEIGDRAGSVIAEGGNVTVIVADDAPYFLARRVDSSRKMRFMSDLETIGEQGASYAVSDLDSALSLCSEILMENPAASVYLFTDTEYNYVPERVKVELVRGDTEWNAAILDASTKLEDGYYVVTVQVACYGVSQELRINVNVEGANSNLAYGVPGSSVEMYTYIDCSDDEVKTVIFRVGGGREDENLFYYDIGEMQKFYSYDSIVVSLEADDSYTVDNSFSIYGGQKEVLKVLYCSTDPNPFIQGALGIARNALSGRFQMEIHEVKKGETVDLVGYDFYVFEHSMPTRIPTDGAVLLLDPDPYISDVPVDAGFEVSRQSDFNGNLFSLAEGEDYAGHPVTRMITADLIEVSLYDVISSYDDAYDVLLSYDSNPLLMVRNDGAVKIGVMAFSVHFSTLGKLPENFLLMYSIIDYFFPSIIDGNTFDVNEEFTLNTWGEELIFTDSDRVFSANEMPAKFKLSTPGSYHFEQVTYYGKNITVEVFIKPPAEESNIRKVADTFDDPYLGTEAETNYRDLLLIIASVLVGLLFLEWFLHSRESV